MQDKNEEFEKIILPAEQMVKNFIKVKSRERNLFGHGICFIARVYNICKNHLRLFNENDYKVFQEDDDKIFFIKISDPDKMKFLMKNYSLFSTSEQIKKSQKNKRNEELLNLFSIVRLGVFGNLKAVDKVFQTGLLKNENNLDGIENQTSFRDFFRLDKENMEKINDDFLDKIEKEYFFFEDLEEEKKKKYSEFTKEEKINLYLEIKGKKKKYSEFTEEEKRDLKLKLKKENDLFFGCYEKLDSLIGDRENGYQVNEESFHFLEKNKFLDKNNTCGWSQPLFFAQSDEKKFFSYCLMQYGFYQQIRLILLYLESLENLKKKENLVWRIMIKKLFKAFNFFLI